MRNKKLIILFSVLLGITLLVVFNSVLFSVQHVNAYCYNQEQSVYQEQVLKAHKIKRGKSIFLVNKKKVIDNVHSAVPQVRVVNVEKKFPNRIWINYVEETEYLQVSQGTKTYYLGKDLRVMRIADGAAGGDAIRLACESDLSALEVGSRLSFQTPNGAGEDIVRDIFNGFSLLGYDDTTVDLLYSIDVTRRSVFITLSNKTATGKTAGMVWEVLSPDNMADKLRLAVSAYMALTDEQKKRGKMYITADKATYSGVSGGVTGTDARQAFLRARQMLLDFSRDTLYNKTV